jgi:hypothetical protein
MDGSLPDSPGTILGFHEYAMGAPRCARFQGRSGDWTGVHCSGTEVRHPADFDPVKFAPTDVIDALDLSRSAP